MALCHIWKWKTKYNLYFIHQFVTWNARASFQIFWASHSKILLGEGSIMRHLYWMSEEDTTTTMSTTTTSTTTTTATNTSSGSGLEVHTIYSLIWQIWVWPDVISAGWTAKTMRRIVSVYYWCLSSEDLNWVSPYKPRGWKKQWVPRVTENPPHLNTNSNTNN